MNIDISRDYACKLDETDELAGYREKVFQRRPRNDLHGRQFPWQTSHANSGTG